MIKLIKIIKLFKFLIINNNIKNIIPLFLWAIIVISSYFKINFIISKLRPLKIDFHIFNKKIKGRVAHIGTIKEAIVEDGYKLDKKIKGDIIDIGANIGISRLILEKYLSDNNKYICIEPDRNNVKLLKNNYPKSKIIPFAVSDKNGYEFFGETNTGITSRINNKSKNKIKVLSIDHIIKKSNLHPGLIKIDVEGSEISVIKGAINTLKRFKPIILIEIHKKDEYKYIKKILYKLNYSKEKYKDNNIWQFN